MSEVIVVTYDDSSETEEFGKHTSIRCAVFTAAGADGPVTNIIVRSGFPGDNPEDYA